MSVRPDDAAKFADGGRPWWLEPAIAAGTAIGGSILQYKLSSKNSNTAHQREVKDLEAAGLNPLLSVMGGRGAPDPVVPDFSGNVGKGLANSLALSQMRAQLKLTNAMADKAQAETTGIGISNATMAGTQESDISMARFKARLADLDVQQRERLFDTAIDKAKADLRLTEASAASLKARKELDSLAAVGARNIAELEKRLGTGSPAALLVLKYLNLLMR